MSTDPFPAAAFGLSSEFTVGSDEFEVAGHGCLQWIEAIFSDRYPFSIAPGMLTEEAEELISDRFLDGDADIKWVQRVARAALACAGGRPWWETERLISSLGSAHLLGHVLSKGVQLDKLTVAQGASVVYALLMEGQDEKGRFMLDAKIAAPPAEAMDDDFDEEDDLAAIALSMRSMPGVSVG